MAVCTVPTFLPVISWPRVLGLYGRSARHSGRRRAEGLCHVDAVAVRWGVASLSTAVGSFLTLPQTRGPQKPVHNRARSVLADRSLTFAAPSSSIHPVRALLSRSRKRSRPQHHRIAAALQKAALESGCRARLRPVVNGWLRAKVVDCSFRVTTLEGCCTDQGGASWPAEPYKGCVHHISQQSRFT